MPNRITPSELVHMIGELPKNVAYSYVNDVTTTKIEIVHIQRPEGPITIKRYDPIKGEGPSDGRNQTISVQMLWRVANSIRPGQPVNLDRILGGSYNTRSALEALLAHTPQFYFCYPGRIEIISSSTEIKSGHKHLLWLPENPHRMGEITKSETEIVISEIPSGDAIYDSLTLPTLPDEIDADMNLLRRHAQIQIALIIIGRQLGFRTWVAQNDRAIEYDNQKIVEMPGIILSLNDERLLSSYVEAARAALFIDCIWFRNSRFMPAVLEIEHTTGVTSGLSRMKNFQDVLPPFPTRWVIVAPDEDREKVMQEANKEQFRSLNTQYFPYSAVEELFSLCQRRHITGVLDEFLDSFMERCLN